MKNFTQFLPEPGTKFISLLCLFFCVPFLNGQEFEQLISSKLEVVDEQDHQIIDCKTYEFNDKFIYENPYKIKLFENQAYRFNVDFAYFGAPENITDENYLQKLCSVQIPASQAKSYYIQAISPQDDKLVIYALATGAAGTEDTFRLQLMDRQANLMADMIYPFEIKTDDPDATFTSLFNISQGIQPLYLTLEDANNPNNRIERELTPHIISQDTINVDANTAFNLRLEIEQSYPIDREYHILVADYEKDYGYRAEFSWEGKALRHKAGSENGLKSYLTIAPAKSKVPQRPVLSNDQLVAKDLKEAGLNQQGSRVKQQFNFVMPNSNLRKVYTSSFLKSHPDLSRSRKGQTSQGDQHQKELAKVQYELKTTNQKINQQYQLDEKTKKQLQQQMRMIQTYKQVDPKTTPTKQTAPAKTKTRVQQQPTVRQEQPQIATLRVPANVYKDAYVQTPKPTQSPYYTLSIEVIRDTELLSHRTYHVTFRVID